MRGETILRTSILLAAIALLTSCTIINQDRRPTPKSQTQVREIQTREFDTNNVNLVMKAVLNTLQDEGFVVKNAVMEIGLITAVKELQISGDASKGNDFWSDMFEQLFRNSSRSRQSDTREQRYDKFKVVEVSVNVTEYGRRCKVRANFQAKVLDNQGDPSEIYTVDDPKFYQDFFSKVDKGIFLQRQGL
jgi:hypothetical protein